MPIVRAAKKCGKGMKKQTIRRRGRTIHMCVKR